MPHSRILGTPSSFRLLRGGSAGTRLSLRSFASAGRGPSARAGRPARRANAARQRPRAPTAAPLRGARAARRAAGRHRRIPGSRLQGQPLPVITRATATGEIAGALLEGEEHTRLAKLPGAVHEEAESYERLARAGSAAYERRGRPAGRPPPVISSKPLIPLGVFFRSP